MKRALLYCPMNPSSPDAPPSGDRTMAGLLARALGANGYEVESASTLRSYESRGDIAQQNRIVDHAGAEAAYLIARYKAAPPALWVTYMNYYKSPDHLGPAVSRALGIPYLIVEASHAAKRATGPFAAPHAAAKRALEQAGAVCCMTEHDRPGLSQVVPSNRLHMLHPFIDAARFRVDPRLPRNPKLIVTVAMLRPGKKLQNFGLIAAALGQILDWPWTYTIAGDGEGRAAAKAMLADLPADRVRFLGRIPPEHMPAIYAGAGLYLWPGLREAYGLAYLEAQAAGLPVVACKTHGVPDVVQHGRSGILTPAGDAAAMAAALRHLLSNPEAWTAMSGQATAFVHTERTLDHAAGDLGSILAAIGA